MHPAPSIILFSTASGAGFGLLAALGLDPGTGWPAFWHFALAYGLAVGGLVSSTFHLGNPQRALLAFTQWRTSWLSREGWLAVAALGLMAPVALAAVFLEARLLPLGVLAGLLALATVFATSMIYAQLRTVPRWHQPLVPAYYLAASLAGGALLAGWRWPAVALLVVLGLVQLAMWWKADRLQAADPSSPETATGLGRIGRVRQFEAPHTGSNYLLKEFGYEVGRRHSAKLRPLALVLMSVVPAVLLALLPQGPLAVTLAAVPHALGLVTSRWLFFAEAEHAVRHYYGLSRAA